MNSSRESADRTCIAGHDAAWTSVVLDIRDEASPLATENIELYALADPAGSIDAAALLRERVIADPPYWALVWTGARAVAAAVADLDLDADTRVLDLGCGLGLSGLAAARRGAAVIFGDYLEEPLAFVRATLQRLGLGHCRVTRVDFTSSDDHGLFDVILAADIVYDRAHYAPLAAFLERHLADGGVILLTESLRADATVFLDGMAARDFIDAKKAFWVMEDGRRERTWLHRLTRRAK